MANEKRNGSIADPDKKSNAEESDEVEEDPFQAIMEKAGNHGRFQLMYNILFVMGLSMAGAMCYMNIILALNIPDHWCTVPGREQTNFTLDEWRRITLPKWVFLWPWLEIVIVRVCVHLCVCLYLYVRMPWESQYEW